MGQADILKIVKKHPDRWFSVSALANALDVSPARIKIWVTKLYRHWDLIDVRRDRTIPETFVKYKQK